MAKNYEYKKATIADIDELVRTRIIVLRAANKLSNDVDMSLVEKESYEYYKSALEIGEHMAYLVYDNETFIGAGGVSFYQVMPTYHNPTGKKAYIMNMYTAPAYRRQGIAFHTLDLLVNPEETGIIAPYKNQVEALSKEITDIDAATVHKFQGKEKENIIISTVDDEISDFADDPYLINVALSRAKKKLMLVVTGNEQSKERNITDLIDYIQYNNFEVTESKIYSIFDYLYKQYTEERRVYLQKHKKVSEYDSENLMYSLIEDIISANKYSSLDVVCHFPLNMLIKNPELLNEQECQYAMNPATHLDFLIYNRIGKKPVLAIEVDGYEYHKEDTVQASRDLLKNHIMELYEIPLLRFMTNGSGEREKIVEMLDKFV